MMDGDGLNSRGGYIKEYTDSEGNSHTEFKDSGDHLEYKKHGSVYMNGKDITEEYNKDFN